MAIKLDGKALAEKMRAQIRQETEMLARRPTLAVILVGEDAASQVYVRTKEKDCAECGILSQGYRLPVQTSETQLLELIDVLNKNDRVDGILVQLPLPDHISQEKVLHAIRPDKDVDAFHPFNVGKIVTGEQGFVPCTPAGVMALLREYEIDIGTVTICHSKTAHLSEVTARVDILVSAVGKTGFITGDMVKKGAVVVDVAMNRNAEGKLCGDCVFDEVEKKASYITPVPGGVGPMTRLVLMQNTLAAVKTHLQG